MTVRAPKVLAIVPDAFGGHGGIALYIRNVLSALSEHPYQPRIVTIARDAPLPVEDVPASIDFRVSPSPAKIRFTLESMRAALEIRRADLVLCGHIHLLPVAAAAQRVVGGRTVLFAYGVDAWQPLGLASRWLVRQVDAAVAIRKLTSDTLGRATGLAGLRRHVLENAIRVEDYGAAPPRRDLLERYGLVGKRVLLTLGRVAHEGLGFDEVLTVLPELVREIPDLVYLVVGDGPHLGALREKARVLGVRDHVAFAGHVSAAEKADHLRLGHAFATPGSHPTGWDDYPLRFVFLEAMACGLPVVASRPRDLNDPATHALPLIYVDPRDRRELKAGLRAALERGPGAPPPELERFSYPAFRDRLNALVDHVMGWRSASRPSSPSPLAQSVPRRA